MRPRPLEACRTGLHSGQMQQPVQVFHAAHRRECEERAFVLTAVGIDSEIDVDEAGFALHVEHSQHAHARHHLWQYEQERQRRAPTPIAFVPKAGAWWGSLAYVLVLLLPPIALAQGWLDFDPYGAGAMHPESIRAGEWWRVLTALTLHGDGAHLLGNLGGGALLGYSAAQLWGSARAWLLILFSAACANLIEALLGYSNYVSVGASTAVFAALGLVSAFAWRTRGQSVGSSPVRWAPLVAGVVLLGMFGAGSGVHVAGMPQPQWPGFADEGATNVLSHVLGFVCGVVVGALAATAGGNRLLAKLPAWLGAACSVAALAAAWGFMTAASR